MTNDIYKAAGVIVKNKKLLVERSIGKEFFISPGGSIEEGETPEICLIRELKEEFSIDVTVSDLRYLAEFSSDAVNHPGKKVHMKVFMVNKWEGDPIPSSEVEEIAWINSDIPTNMKVGSIIEHDIIPLLHKQALID